MVRPSLLSVLMLLTLPACGAVWGLDEVTRADGEGGGGAGATTMSSTTSTSTTSTASEGGGGGAGCDCGCPSLIPHGDFETEDDVTQFDWDLGCPSELVPAGTCSAIRVAGVDQYCGHVDFVSSMAVGDQCLVGRVRARGTPGAWVALQVTQEGEVVTAQGVYATLGGEYTDRPFACRLPPEMTIDRVRTLINKGGEGEGFVLEIDHAELDVAPCTGTEDLCDEIQ